MNTINIIDRIAESGCSFVLYRYPRQEEPRLVLQLDGDAQPLSKEEEEPRGYVFAPFRETKEHPTLIIQPDIVATGWEEIDRATQQLPQKKLVLKKQKNLRADSIFLDEEHYQRAFNTFMGQIVCERLTKIVLSRCLNKYDHTFNTMGKPVDAAMKKFPNSLVYLLYTPTSGRWMGCTPELLLEGADLQWQTISLAGTKAWGEKAEWDTKNVWEQDIVSRYIKAQLDELGAQHKSKGPYTAQAGPLLHLRTDFEFTLPQAMPLMRLIRHLYPTPAICGMPREDAYSVINTWELNQRGYYSGFMGAFNLEEVNRIYVNLRCVNIHKKANCFFYAGGGLNALSRMWEEKQELERKFNVLSNLC